MNIKYWIAHSNAIMSRVKYWLYEKIFPNNPWLTPAAVDYLKKELSSEYVGFEWGSGKSTIWLGKQLKKLISIEHDITWFKKIQRKIKLNNLVNVDHRYIPLDYPETKPMYPYYDTKPKYCSQIDSLPDDSNRLTYKEWQVPRDWKMVHASSNGLKETTIWQK